MRVACVGAVALFLVANLSAQMSPTTVAANDTSAMAVGSTAAPRTATTNAPKVLSNTEVPPTSAILTLDGVCDNAQKAGKTTGCKTVVTRAQMDALVDAILPSADQEIRAQFAINYARLLAAGEVAKRRKLDTQVSVQKEIEARQKMARLQVLASSLYKSFQVESVNVPQAEILRYYAAHAGNYELGDVQRLTIPKSGPANKEQSVDEAAAKAKAQGYRARAAAGEDFDALQQEIYKDMGINAVPPSTKWTGVRKGSLPPDQARVFELRPGETSDIVEWRGSYVVLKLNSKKVMPVESVQSEIETLLKRERMQDDLRIAAASVKADFNLKYLGTTSVPELFPAPSVNNSMPTSGSAASHRPRPGARHALVRAVPSNTR